MRLKSFKELNYIKESLLAIGFLLLAVYNIQAQTTFNKIYSIPGHREEFSTLLQIDSFYYFVGGSIEENSNNDSVKLVVLQTDFDGNFINQLNYQFDSISIGGSYNSNNIISWHDGFLLSGSYQNKYENQQDGSIIKFVDFLAEPEILKYELDSSEIFPSLFYINNSFFIFGMTNAFGNNFEYYLINSDTLGNILRDTIYGGADWDGMGNAVKVNENLFVFCGQTFSDAQPRIGWGVNAANAQFIAVDTNFNIIWNTVLYTQGVDEVPMVKEHGFFYYYVEHPVTFDTYREDFVGIIGQIDLDNGNLLWRDTVRFEEEIYNPKYMETIDSTSFIVFCQVESSELPYEYAKILKYNNQGDLLWERSYYEGNHNGCGLNTMIVDDEGYLVFGGTIANLETQSQDAWLLKLRPDGCLNDEDCGIVSGLIDLTPQRNKFQMLVSPNPSSGLAQIIVENTVGFKGKDLLLQVFDVNSKLIYQEKKSINGALPIFNIDISTQPSGTYYIQAVVEGVSLGEGKLVLAAE